MTVIFFVPLRKNEEQSKSNATSDLSSQMGELGELCRLCRTLLKAVSCFRFLLGRLYSFNIDLPLALHIAMKLVVVNFE